MMTRCKKPTYPLFITVIGVVIFQLVSIDFAHAVVSYARQTGEACNSCHIGSYGPTLTARGRQFKIDGYTEEASSNDDNTEVTIPLALGGVFSSTHTRGTVDGDNADFKFRSLTAYLAGDLTQSIGSFVRVSYAQSTETTRLGRADFRYTKAATFHDEDMVMGFGLNNAPVSTDAFLQGGLSAGAVRPIASGTLDGQIGGVTGYAFWKESIYAELGVYRSLSEEFMDTTNIVDSGMRVSGVSPYARLAYTRNLHKQNYSFGVFALAADLYPTTSATLTNKYQDIGVDATYQFLGNRRHLFNVNTSYVHESRDLDAAYASNSAAFNDGSLNVFRITGTYYFLETYGFSAGWFDGRGSYDQKLYSRNRTYTPDTSGSVYRIEWTPFGKEESWKAPWANVRMEMSYTKYDTFNGASSNYNNQGRDAKDNDTLMLTARFGVAL